MSETLELLNSQFQPEFPIANVKAITTLAITGQIQAGWEIAGHGGYVVGWSGAYQAGAFGNAASLNDQAAAGEFRSACCEAIETLTGNPPEAQESGVEGPAIDAILAMLMPIILEILKKRFTQ